MAEAGELEVLLFDNHLLAVAKPAGLPIVPDKSGDESLLERAKRWVAREFDKPGDAFLGVVHRLDRPVSGVVLFARTSKAASRLSDQFRLGEAQKEYRAVGEGVPEHPRGVLEQWLLKDADTNVVSVAAPNAPGAKRSVTRWEARGEVRAEGRVLTQLDVRPETGRAHQIRVALSTLGCPILGDVKYGAAGPLRDRSIALHGAALTVRHPTRKDDVRIECPPPDRSWWRLA
jgi:23S rRNA pseudouridine1911/1915/1917 synthase